MENQTEFPNDESLNVHPQIDLINNFCEITTCASKSEALFFLESHNFDLDAAVSTFLDNSVGNASVVSAADLVQPAPQLDPEYSPSEDDSASPSRSRSPSPPLVSRSNLLRLLANPNAGVRRGNVISTGNRGGGRGGRSSIRTLADLNKNPREEDSDSDDPDFNPQEYYTGGEKSGMLVQGPPKKNNVDKIFKKARESGGSSEPLPSSSKSFFGTARVLSGEPSSTLQPPETVNHNITFWRNGFTVDDGPLRRLDDPANESFLRSMTQSECPAELAPANKETKVQVSLMRKEEDYPETKKRQSSFHGVGRTLGSTSDEVVAPVESNPISTSTPSLTVAPTAVLGLVVDQAQPSTSIQLRLADGTRMVSRFNNHHTIRDIRGFIDASRPAGSRAPYQLQTMGFPPKQLTELDQTIDEAGIANSVVIQKLL